MAVRTVTCPSCGRTHLLGHRCPCKDETGSTGAAGRERGGPRIAALIATFVGTAGIIAGLAFALAAGKGTGYGVALAVGAWLLLHLCRLGYDMEDGIDVRQLIFPAPLDWPVKIESFVNFWTSPRAFFRAAYLGAMLAAAIVIIALLAGGRG